MGPYAFLFVLKDSIGLLRVVIGAYGFLWVHIGPYCSYGF